MADKVGKKTGKKTKAGRDVYKTSKGESVSEKSVTIKFGENAYVNAPSIHDGIKYSEDEVKQMLLDGKIKPTSRHDTLEEALEAAKSRSKSLMNKGGTAMDVKQQMSMFEEGGLNHQGGTKDPVSGNDVPIGSTQKEVRDDIPAMLSEGEYVIPADVVRFYGIKFFEELRMGAKEGMQLLDAKGQMGNGDEQVVPDDVPFDLEDLMIDAEQDDVINAQKGTFVPASTYSLPSNVQQYGYYTAPTVPQYGTAPIYAQPVYTAPSQVETPQPYLSYEQLVGSSQMPTKTEETTEEDTTSEDTADETKVETARVVEAQDSEGTPSASDVADAEQFDRDSLMSSTVAGIEGLSLDSKGKLEFDSKFDLGPIGTLAGFVSGPIGTIGSLASAIGDKGPQASGVTALGQTLSELGYNRSELDAIGGSLIGAAGIFSKGVDSDYGKAVEKGLAAYAKTNNLTMQEAYAQISKLALQRAEKLFGDPTGGTGGGYGVYGGTSGYMDPDTGVVSAFGPKGSFAALMEKDLSKAIEVAKNQDFLSKTIYDLQQVVQPAIDALGGRAPEAAQPAEGIGYGSGALGMTQAEAAEEEAAMIGDVETTTSTTSDKASRESEGAGAGDSDSGPSYICTAAVATGITPAENFKTLKKYGLHLRRTDPYMMKTYDMFGPTAAKFVGKSRIMNGVAKFITTYFVAEMNKTELTTKQKLFKIFTRTILRPSYRVVGWTATKLGK